MSLEPYHPIDADAAEELIAKGVKVIDVRQPYEYGYDHIEQAVLVSIDGLYSFSQALNQLNLSKDEPLIFVCEMGQRSTAACEVAAIAGYTNIYNLSGGMNMWRYSGKMVVKGQK
ncbi:MAG: rhodanese-like domain-containing protein [Chloroflexi bacterium]|uniref:Rhodanese-like domain-containing protein n=1 Tax=Candidatus Chlorohelix allophototropha TaxID=3003348 RepID=A0A8T7M279_9CHLR|nr:rhodanese-like domain-containing protein [Chloroflexota bacterium]WJW66287.1 rhodanese-like domain-containing protein [Chloroflexota bacterium L227-S17]